MEFLLKNEYYESVADTLKFASSALVEGTMR